MKLEVFDLEIAIKRSIQYYQNRRYSDEWIEARLKGIVNRDKITSVWGKMILQKIMSMEF